MMAHVGVKLFFTIITGVISFLGFDHGRGWATDFSVAFYYGAHAPLDELKAFDVVVVDPNHGYDPVSYQTPTSELFAYVSVGELESYRAYTNAVPTSWVIGENKAWDSKIIDQSRPEWPNFVTDNIITPLWKRGYRGFFLDTLDSYHLVSPTKDKQRKQEKGLIAVIQSIKQAYPDAKLILNRGFEIIPDVADHVYALAVESLFQGWNQTDKRFVKVPPEDREWLLAQLNVIRQSYHLPTIIIDYLPATDRERAREIAKKIQQLGMIPWVSTPELNLLGVGALEVMPRKVLLIFDGTRDPDAGHSDIHRFIDLPLNYLGYIPEHWDIHTSLPEFPLIGRYAGIVSWLPTNDSSWSHDYHQWLVKQMMQGTRVVLFDSFGFPFQNQLLKPFQLKTKRPPKQVRSVRFTHKDKLIGYEIEPIPNRRHFVPLTVEQGQPLLSLTTTDGQRQDSVAYTPWGGYALNPYVVAQLPDGETYRWIITPIQFLRKALSLPIMPVPDTTTQNGRRLLLIHIDGDGFPSRAEIPGTPFAGEVLYRDVLRKYSIPTTVSIIEGEVGSTGLYPQHAEHFEQIARAMFALPHVELASHSYSHPYFWRDFIRLGSEKPGKYHLPVSDYVYGQDNFRREIQGSIQYINERLAPPGKRVEVFLWTGDCDPPSEAVKEAYAVGVGNMNGGDTIITRQNKSLTAVAPLGIKKGQYFQVYAPNQNENLYTNEWRGPFYGFQQVIETFRLTDRPLRLKPINIYYHTYSASKKASLVALHKVYQWALSQPINPIYVSEYIQKVHEFNRIVVAKKGEGWHIRGAGHLRELRIPQSAGYPDLEKSKHVGGFSEHESARYVHLTDSRQAELILTPTQPSQPYLVDTNGQIRKWARTPETIELELIGPQPLTVSLAHISECRLNLDPMPLLGERSGRIRQFTIEHNGNSPVALSCR